MEDTQQRRFELPITSLAHKRGRGTSPRYFCANCRCNRYSPCHCALGGAAADAEWKRVTGKTRR